MRVPMIELVVFHGMLYFFRGSTGDFDAELPEQ